MEKTPQTASQTCGVTKAATTLLDNTDASRAEQLLEDLFTAATYCEVFRGTDKLPEAYQLKKDLQQFFKAVADKEA